jgi:hypothetical protein
MVDVDVAVLSARYRLPRRQLVERPRLDGILAEVVAAGLDDAAVGLSVGSGDEICVRSVAVPVRLRLRSSSDPQLRDAWSRAIAVEIQRALEAGGSNVVRYANRGQAMLDVVRSGLAGDDRRAWAWRRLGLWGLADGASPSACRAETIRALAGTDGLVVPVLAALASSGEVRPIVEALSTADLVRLAMAAVRIPVGRWTASWTDDLPRDRLARVAVIGRPGTDRPLGNALRPAIADAAEPSRRRALAILAAIDAAPELVTAGPATVAAAAARWLATRSLTERPAPPSAGATHGGAKGDPDADDRGSGSVEHLVPGSDPTSREAAATDEIEAMAGLSNAAEIAPSAVAESEAAGLLFLLHVVAELDLAERLRTSVAFAGRAGRWWFHRLGLELAGIEPDDPAALAFTGLSPTDRPPSADAPAPTQRELRAVRRFAVEVRAALADRLGPAAGAPRTLAGRVVARRGRIVADPGWIELQLALAEVDLDVRRAGLDLDPGFVPWLGCVVRFRYD